MSSERDRARRLADEVRAAVAATAPSSAPSIERESSTPEEQAAASAAGRAASYMMPGIPRAARLAGVKRGALRALRFLWRDQSSFNALALEALDGLRQAVARERRERIAERDGREAGIARLEAARLAADRRASIQDGRLADIEARGFSAAGVAHSAAPGGAPGPAAGGIPPGVYSLFEERFRGTESEVARKQRFYLPLFAELPGQVLDVGCGRGEFLQLLAQKKIAARGVDANPLAVRDCREAGLDVVAGDGLATLASASAGSLGGIVAFQVVEHWTSEAVFAFLREACRVLAPGGLLVAETINTDSLSAWRAFYLDPSHVRPVPPDALRFLAEAAGFVQARIEFLSPLAADDRLEEGSANDAKLNRLLFGPQDYALIARTPGPRA